MSAPAKESAAKASTSAAAAQPAVAGGSGTGKRRVRKTRTVTRKVMEKNEKGYRGESSLRFTVHARGRFLACR